MDEQQWLTCNEPSELLDHLLGLRYHTRIHDSVLVDRVPQLISDRKLRLFSCGCLRRGWDQLVDPYSRQAVEVAERFADGQATNDEMSHIRKCLPRTDDPSFVWQGQAASNCVFPDGWNQGIVLSEILTHHNLVPTGTQCDLLRCVVGNPFKPVLLTVDCPDCDPPGSGKWVRYNRECGVCLGKSVIPYQQHHGPHPWLAWNDGCIPAMAAAVYEARNWDDLPLLADALEEAGCDNVTILSHLRNGGSHGRGCWVLDLLLEKS